MSKEKTTKKILAIGIDGGTFDIIEPMLEENLLPNIASLMNRGTHGRLLSTIPPVTAPAWSSFITGANPGRHGVAYFFDRQLNEYKLQSSNTLMNLGNMKGIPFWRVLNKYGYKVGLMNVPLTYPPDKLDGFMISGMLVPYGSNDYVYPVELLTQLEDYSVDLDGLINQNRWQVKELIKNDKKKFIHDVCNLSRSRANNALKLMRTQDWNFFMVVFTGSDRICHFFWDDAQDGETYGVIREYYVLLDSLIGQLIDEAGENAVKIIMSDHGFGRSATRQVNALTLMRRLGHTAYLPGSKTKYLKTWIEGKLGKSRKVILEDFIDWKKTKLYSVPVYNNYLGICINTRGEKKEGIVSSGKEYDLLKKEVVEYLEGLKDPASGKKIVSKIHYREDTYAGPLQNQFPDITAQFLYDYKVSFSPMRRGLIKDAKDPIQIGDHRREGMFIASGSMVEAATIEREIFIEDVTTSILYLMGVPVPDTYGGRVINEIFSRKFMDDHPLKREAGDESLRLQAFDAEKGHIDEFEKSKELLKNLGYL